MPQTAEDRELIGAEDIFGAEIAHWHAIVAEKARAVSEMALSIQDQKNALKVFLGEYNSRAGVFYAKLDRLDLHIEIYRYRIRRMNEMGAPEYDGELIEKEIAEKFGERLEQVKRQEEESTRSSDEHRANLSRQERWEMLEEGVRRRIKVLYRKLALRFHPDKAASDEERGRLHDIMAAINQAYTNGDIDVLILYVEQAEKEDRLKVETPWEKLQRLKKETENLTRMLIKLRSEKENILASEAWQLKHKFDAGREDGEDLFVELTRRLRNEIKQKEAMLEELVGTYRVKSIGAMMRKREASNEE